ncbi:hypothetical protein MANES_01G135701v8 [Manihot esculenta]|uniref:Uncharacterized protein n=1 Tax=Manihot esculenta TaxID=3983 RepID=A0ACB7IE57_MANES|nr:hypothetical protein MANES_01G135701v8 [Manihot esculenta]
MDCLLLCIQTMGTFLFTPIGEQNCRISCSSCFWIFHPNLSANSIILSFYSWLNFVLNLFFNNDGCINLAPCKFVYSNVLRSSLDDSVRTTDTSSPSEAHQNGCSRSPGGAHRKPMRVSLTSRICSS